MKFQLIDPEEILDVTAQKSRQNFFKPYFGNLLIEIKMV